MSIQEEIFELAVKKGIAQSHVNMVLSFFHSSALMSVLEKTAKTPDSLSDDEKQQISDSMKRLQNVKNKAEYVTAMREVTSLFSSDTIDAATEFEKTYDELLQKFLEKMKKEN